jgi:hypothetical protein
MGGGDYKEERERACVVSHCHSAGDLDDPPKLSLPYLYLRIIAPWESHHLPGPITPQEPRLASAQLGLVLSSTALPLPPFPPQPGLSSPGIRAFQFNPLPSIPPTHISIDL